MNPTKLSAFVLFCILIVGAFAADVMAQHREARRAPEPCLDTAWNMMRACKIDTREDSFLERVSE